VKDPGLVLPIESGAANPVRGGIFVVVGRGSISSFCFFGGAAGKRFSTLWSFSLRRRKNKTEGCLGRCSYKYATPNGVLQEVWLQPKQRANRFSLTFSVTFAPQEDSNPVNHQTTKLKA